MKTRPQYSVDDGHYKPVRGTVSTLPDGLYTIHSSFTGPFLKKKDVVHDHLIDVDDSEAGLIIREIDKFWKMKESFSKLGVIHKRGFLLYGPPGTGKTSITNIIAERMSNSNTLVLYPTSDPEDLTSIVTGVREVEPTRKILVIIEDLDNFYQRDEIGFLSLLDGQNTVESVVFLATTNFIDDIPERIKDRPSRFDRKIEIGKPSLNMRSKYIDSKLSSMPAATRLSWAQKTEGLALAHIKELIISVILFENDFETEVNRLRDVDMTAVEKSETEED